MNRAPTRTTRIGYSVPYTTLFRSERGGDDVDAPGRAHIVPEGARPGGQPPRRPADQPAQRPGFFAEAVERASQLAEAAVRLPHPARQYVEIARDARRRRPLDDEADIAPSILGPRPEIIVTDVEPADDDARFFLGVGERE